MSEVRRGRGLYSAARLPAGRGAAGRRGAAVEVLLRRAARRASSTRSSAGSASGRCRGSQNAGDGHAVARARGDLGGRRRHRDHLPRRADRRSGRSCTTRPRSTAPSIWQKVWHVTLPQLRGILLVTLILQIIGTAQVFLEPFLFTGGGPANATMTVLLLIYNYAFQNSLGGDYGEATALSLMLAAFLAVLSRLLPADPRGATEHVSRLRTAGGAARSAATPTRERRRPRRSVSRGPTGAERARPLGLLRLRARRPAGVPARRRARADPVARKSAVTPTQDTLRQPLALWPNGIDLANLRDGVERSTSTATSSEHGASIAAGLVGRPDRRRHDRRATRCRCCGRGSAPC